MGGTPRKHRLAMVVLLLLCGAAPSAEAQQFVCWPIVPGDTASTLARRLTGNPASAWSQAFQIRDPARQMFVPKSQYRRLNPSWQACVASGPLMSTPLAYAPDVALGAPAAAPAEPAVAETPVVIRPAPPAPPPATESRVDFVFISTIASAVLLMLSVGAVIGDSLVSRPIPPVMQRAGEDFVVAFARPLVDLSSNAPPIQVRLRFVPQAQQLEISIAPGAGRRYPNLVDHRRNVEYDVNRVMHVLGNQFVVSDRLRAAGKWVVVPIRLTDVPQTGAQ
jgi:hypothetical protein